MQKLLTYHGMTLSPGCCFVEFKVDTPFFGCLTIDRFQLKTEDCDEIQRTGVLRWQGHRWPILTDRTADARRMDEPYCGPLIIFVTDRLSPIDHPDQVVELSREERFRILNKFSWHPNGDDDAGETALNKKLKLPGETWQIGVGSYVMCYKDCEEPYHVHIGQNLPERE